MSFARGAVDCRRNNQYNNGNNVRCSLVQYAKPVGTNRLMWVKGTTGSCTSSVTLGSFTAGNMTALSTATRLGAGRPGIDSQQSKIFSSPQSPVGTG
jgi:hypothetical protein